MTPGAEIPPSDESIVPSGDAAGRLLMSRRAVMTTTALIAAGIVTADGMGASPTIGSAEAAQTWGGHANGQIPTSAMTYVPADFGPYLRSDAAAAYFAFSDAFKSNFGKALGITEAYRSLAQQQNLYDKYKAGTGNYAAYPGGSPHGYALACDFKSGVNTYGTAEKKWADANGPRFGWIPTGNSFPAQREPWHFEYILGEAPTPPATTNEESERNDMYVNRNLTGEVAVFGSDYRQVVGGAAGRHSFKSFQEYQDWRELLRFYNQQIDAQGLDARNKMIVPPYDIKNIVGVSEATWALLGSVYGV
jgi:hypothetical protein